MNLWREAWLLLRQYWPLWLALTVVFLGLVAASCAAGNSEFDAWFTERLIESRQLGIAQWALASWWGKNFLATAVGIAGLNFFVGSLLYLTLPSLAIPGAALPLVLFRAFVWGIITADWAARRDYGQLFLIILEGEAYVLATMAAVLHARAWLAPKRVNAASRGDGYRVGMRQNLAMQMLVAAELVVAALYETVLITVVGRS